MKSTEKGETQEGDVLVTITKGLSYVPGLDVGVSENHRRSKIHSMGLAGSDQKIDPQRHWF